MTIHKFTNDESGVNVARRPLIAWLSGYGYDFILDRVVSFKQYEEGYFLSKATSYKLSNRGQSSRGYHTEIKRIAEEQIAASKASFAAAVAGQTPATATTRSLWPAPKAASNTKGNTFAAAVAAAPKHVAAQFPTDPFAAYPATVLNKVLVDASIVYSATSSDVVSVPAGITVEGALSRFKDKMGYVIAPGDLRIVDRTTEQVVKLTRKTTYTI